jgi:cell division protein FtsW (lipid II flippase)
MVCVVLFVIVALVVALGVVILVKDNPDPNVNHKKVALAFWINSGLNLLAAFSLFFLAIRSNKRSWKSTSVLIFTGLLVIVLGLALADAGSAYQELGSVSIILFICAGIDILAGVAAITTAFLRPKEA